MGITDIPAEVVTALKYSLRSPGSFILSLISAIAVLGIGYDLLYGFFYTRLNNVKDPHYGDMFWIGLGICGGLVPLVCAGITCQRARRKLRRFPPGRFGIAIAPFDVSSLDPDTLGTSTKLAALDQVMRQYFNVAKRACDAQHWLENFEFRFLPAYVRFHDKQEAVKLWKSMDATVVISGEILQGANGLLGIKQNILGTQVDIQTQGSLPVSVTYAGTSLAFFALCSAGFRLAEAGKGEDAYRMFSLAKDGPAKESDKLDPNRSKYHENMVDSFINKLEAKPQSSEHVASAA